MNVLPRLRFLLLPVLLVPLAAAEAGDPSDGEEGSATGEEGSGAGHPTDREIAGYFRHSTWRMVITADENLNLTRDQRIRFGAEGEARILDGADKTPHNDTWEIRDGRFLFLQNDAFVTYSAEVGNDRIVHGGALNRNGETWEFALLKLD